MRSPPLKIMMVLHYHCHPASVKPGFSEDSPAYKKFMTDLIAADILYMDEGTPHTTDKGKAYVEGLCQLGYPTPQWGYSK